MRAIANFKETLIAVVTVLSMVGVVLPANVQTAGAQVAKPTNLVVTAASGGLDLAWTVAQGTADVTVRWRVKDKDPDRSSDQPGPWLSETLEYAAENHSIYDLVNGVVYEVGVNAVDEDGTATAWTAATGTPAPYDSEVPAAAAQLSAVQFATSTDGTSFANKNLVSPGFSGRLTTYHAVVGANVTHLKLTPTANVSGAALTGSANGPSASVELSLSSGAQSAAIALEHGNNDVTVNVESSDGTEYATYTFKVQRLPQAPTVTVEPYAHAGEAAAILRYPAPPTGFIVRLRTKLASEAWSDDLWSDDGPWEHIFSGDAQETWVEGVTSDFGATTTVVVVTGLKPGTAYHVAANIDEENVGWLSDWTGARVEPPNPAAFTTWGVPGVPTNLRARPVADNASKLNVSWNAPTATGGTGAAISGYKLRWRVRDGNPDEAGPQPGGWLNIFGEEGDDAASSPHMITELASSTAYEVQVRTLNGIDPGSAWSAASRGTTAQLRAPSKFEIDAGDQKLEVSWSAANSAFNDGYVRWRVKDADPNSGGPQPGAWNPVQPADTPAASLGESFFLDSSLERQSVTLAEVCGGCDALTNGTTYQVQLDFERWDEATSNYVRSGWVDAGEGTPTSDPPTTLTLSADGTVAEGGTLTVTATLDKPAKSAVTVTLRAVDATTTATATEDYTLPAAFSIAKGATSATADVAIVDDDIAEESETLTLTTSVSGLSVVDADTIIIDDDTVGVNLDTTGATVRRGATAQYTATLNSRPSAAVTITATSSDESQATVEPSSRVFAPSAWNAAQTFTVTGKALGTPRINHEASSGDSNYQSSLTIDPFSVTVKPIPGVVVSDASPAVEVGMTATYTVTLNSRPSADVTVTATSADKTKVTVEPSSRVFTPAEWNTAQTFTVGAVAAGTHSITHEASSADADYQSGLQIADVNAAVSSNTRLRALSVTESSDGTSFSGPRDLRPRFTEDHNAYTLSVANDVIQVRLTPTVSDPGATVAAGVSGGALTAVASGSASSGIAVPVGDTTIDVRVTGGDGTTRTYALTVTRRTPIAPGTVRMASVESGDGAFTATWELGAGVRYPGVRWRVADADSATPGAQPGDWEQVTFLTVGRELETTHRVTSLVNGVTYEVGVDAAVSGGTPQNRIGWSASLTTVPTRAAPVAAAARLSALSASVSSDGSTFATAAVLNPAFSPLLTDYYVIVPDTVTQLKLTPTAAASGATIRVRKGSTLAAVGSGQQSGALSLGAGDNTVTVTVKSADASATQTYTVTVQRLPVPPPPTVTPTATNSGEPGLRVTADAPPGATLTHRVSFKIKLPDEDWDTVGRSSAPDGVDGVGRLAGLYETDATLSAQPATVYEVRTQLVDFDGGAGTGAPLRTWAGNLSSPTVRVTTWEAPGVPTGLTVTPYVTERHNLRVDWTPPAYAGGEGAAITGYVVAARNAETDRDPNTDGVQPEAWTEIEVGGGRTSALIRGLEISTAYDVRVRALNDVDPGSDWTAIVNKETDEEPPPSTLRLRTDAARNAVTESDLTVTLTATLDWSAPAGGLPVTLSVAAGSSATAGADYTLPGSFTIAEGDRSATAQLTIKQDSIDENDETIELTATAGTLSAPAVTVTISDDADTAGVTVSESTVTAVEGATAGYTVELDSQPTAQVVVTPTSGRTGVATVTPAAVTFTTANWDTAQTFTVNGLATGASTITHAASGSDPKYGSSLGIGSVTATVVSPAPSMLTVSVPNPKVSEGAGAVAVTATLDQPAKSATTVTFTASGGSATAGADYTVPATFTGLIAIGATSATATVTITGDQIDEDDETFEVAASGGGLTAAAVTVTIEDDDAAGITIAGNPLTVIEGSTATYTVVLDSRPGSQVVVTQTSGTKAVATVLPAKLTFTTANYNTAQTFTVSGLATGSSTITHASTSSDPDYATATSSDSDSESDSGSADAAVEISDVTATVEKPPPSTLTLSSTDTTVDEGAGEVTVTATFDEAVKAATTVTFTASGGTATAGSDYTVPATFTAAFTVGQSSGTATVSISDDRIDEGTGETFGLAAEGGGLTAAPVTVTITDDDDAGVDLSEAAVTVIEDATNSYTVVLESEPSAQVVITPTSGTPEVATVAPAAVTFTAQDWETEQTFTVSGLTTGESEIAHAVSGTAAEYGSSLTVDSVTATVEKPDPTTLTLSLAATTVAEDEGEVTVTAALDWPAKAATTVTFTASGGSATAGSDYTAPQTFTAAIAVGATKGTATFTVAEDSIAEGDETFELAASGGGLTAAAVTVTITDNDSAGVTVSHDSLTVLRQSGETYSYTVKLDSEPEGTVTIAAATSASAVATVTPASRSFTSSDWNTPQTFTVTGAATGTASVTHTATATDPNYSAATVGSVEVTVENPPPSKVTLTTGAASNTVAEGSGTGTVRVTATLDWPAKDADVIVTLSAASASTAATSDYTLPGAFTIRQGQSAASVDVGVTDDEVDEDAETLVLSASAGDLTVEGVTLTVSDDDEASVNLSETALDVVNGEKRTYTVRLGSQPEAQVTVTPAVAVTEGATGAASLSPQAVTFTTANWRQPQTVTVTATQVGAAQIGHAASGDSKYGSGLSAPSVALTVTAPPTRLALFTDASGDSVGEGGGPVTVTATLDAPAPQAGVVVTLAAASGTTAAASEYTLPAAFTISDGETTATAEVTLTGDDVDEDAEKIVINTAVSGLTVTAVTLTVEDDDTAGVVVSDTSLTVDKGAGATYTVKLASEPTHEVRVAAESGTPANATVTPATLTFTADDWSDAQAVGVSGAEVGESAVAHSVSSSDAKYSALTSVSSVAVTVIHPPPATVTLSTSAAATVTEGDAAAAHEVTVTATLDQPARSDSTVRLAADRASTASRGSDYRTLPTVTILKGERTGTAVVRLRGDEVDEDDEKLILSGDAGGLTVNALTLTITDDDTAGVDVGETARSITKGAFVRFVTPLESRPTHNVTLAVTSSDSDTVDSQRSQVTIEPGNWAAPRSDIQSAVLYAKEVGTATISFTATSDDPNYDGITIASIVVTVTPPPSKVDLTTDAVNGAVTEGDTVTVTATLDRTAGSEILVTLAQGSGSTTDSDDLFLPNISFSSGEKTKTATFTITDDDDAEGDETLVVDGTAAGLTGATLTLTVEDNDTVGVTVSEESLSVGGGGEETYTVVLTSRPTASVVVTATSGTPDAATVSGPVTFTTGDWGTAQTFTVTGVKSGSSSITHAVTGVSGSSDPAYTSLTPGSVSVASTDPPPSRVNLSTDAVDNEVSEPGSAAVTATLDWPAGVGGVEVTLSAGGSSTASPDDYTLPSVVTVSEGARAATVTVTINDDDWAEGEETLVVDASAGGLGANGLTLTITDTDTAGVGVGVKTLSVLERATATYEVVLESRPIADVVVTPGSDATATATVSGALTFAPGNWSDAQTVTVTGVEAGSATVSHLSSSSRDGDYQGLKVADVVVTVNEAVPTKLTLTTDAASNSASESAGSVTVTATLDQPAGSGGVAVTLTSSGTATAGTDYTLPSSFTISEDSRSATATVTITGDDVDESDETVVLDATAGDLAVAGVTLTIVDDDTAAVKTNVTRLTFNHDQQDEYEVKLGSKPLAEVKVTPSVAASGVAAVEPSVLTFTTADWDAAQTVTVSSAGGGTSTISHSATSTGDSGYDGLSGASVAVTVVTPRPTVITVNAPEQVREGDGAVTVTVTLDWPAKADLRVTFAGETVTGAERPQNELDYRISAVTIPKGSKSVSANLEIVDDDIAENTETMKLRPYTDPKVSNELGTEVTITDDDPAGIAVDPDSIAVVSGGSAAEREKTYEVELTSEPTANVTLRALSSATGKATVKPATLTFTAADWDTAQTFTVTAVDGGSASITHTATSDDTHYNAVSGLDAVAVTVAYPAPTSLVVTTDAVADDSAEDDDDGDDGEDDGDDGEDDGDSSEDDGDGSSSSGSVAEDGGSVTVTATLDYPAGAEGLVVNLTAGGSATIGADYTMPSSFTVAAGERTGTATVAVTDDDLVESSETIVLSASAGSLGPSTATVTITDNDTAGVTVSASALTVVKGATNATKTYTVVLDTKPTSQVTVTPNSGTTAVATVAPTARTFTTGNWNTPQTFTVTGVEAGTSTITHASSSSDTDYGSSLMINKVVATVENPDPSTLTVTLTNTTIDEDIGTVTVTATFDQPVKAATTVTFTVSGGTATAGTDFTVPQTFTGVAAIGQSVATATVTITDDKVDETNETFTVAASAGSLTSAAETVTITDNDTAGVAVSEESLTVVKGAKKTYTVVLGSQPTSQVTITPTSGKTGVATVAPSAYTFTTSNWSDAQTVTVTGVVTGTSTISHAASSTDTNYSSALDIDEVDVTVENPDPSTLTVSLESLTVAEDAGDVTVTATFDQPVKATTTVTFTATGDGSTGKATKGTDFTVPNTFTGVAAKGQSVATATVAVTDDDLAEGDETFTLAASAGSITAAAVTVTITDNDDAGVTVSESALTVVKGAMETYTVVLDTKPTSQVTVTPNSGTTAVATVAPTARTFTTGNWNTPQTFTVTGIETGTSTVTHASSSSDADYGSSLTINKVEATVENPDPSTLTVSLASTTVAEDAGDVTVTATFDQPVKAATTVTFTATSDTATAGTDFTVPQTFTGVAATGQTVATATVTITDDKIDETNETFTVAASAGTLTAAAETVTITDDDTAGVTVSESSLTVIKGSTKTYTVVLDSQPTAQVTVTPSSGTGTVATFTPAARSFSTTNWDTPQTFTVSGVETGMSTITHAASGTDSDYGASLTINKVEATVENPDPSTLTVSLTNTTIDEDVGTVTVTATFDQPVKAATTVTFTASGGTASKGTDYTVPQTFTASVAVGATEATGTVTITDDKIDEENETFEVKAEAGDVESAAVTVTITDDDTAGLVASSSSVAVTGSGTVSYTVKLGSQPTHSVSVTPASSVDATATVATGNGDDLLTFTTDNWGTAQTVTVTGAAAGTAAVTHTSTSDDPNYVITAASASVAVTVRGLVFGASAVTAVGTGTVTYTVRLSSEPAGDVTVTATSAATATATVSPTTRTFTTDNWNTPQAFTVTGVATGATSITHASASDDDSNYQITQAGSVDVTVGNPDPSTLTVSLTSKTVAENVGDVTLTATFDQPVKTATTVTFTATSGTATAGTDFTVPQTFTGVAATGQSVATATVTITDDDIDETNETFTVAVSDGGSLTAAAVTVTITDDDTAGVTISADELTIVKGAKKTYTIVLDSQPTSQVVVTPESGTIGVATVAPTARTFETSDWDTEQTFTVTGIETGTSTVTHASSSSDADYGSSLTINKVEATVENPDPSTLTVSLANTTVAEDAGDVTVTATFDQPVKAATTVTFTATSDTATAGTDFTVPQTFTGVAATGQSVATATVTITDDKIDETNETFTVAASAGTLTAAAETVTITDDDTAGVTVSESSLTVIKGSTKTYTVVLDSQPTAQVTVTPSSGTGTVATFTPAARSFSTTNWDTPQTFTVSGVETGMSTITHAASGTDSDYGASLTINKVEATVENPDPSTLTVSLTNTTIDEDVGTVTVTATFDQPVKAATTVTFTASGGTASKGTDYTVPQTFTASVAVGATEATGTVTITDDKIDEENETFEVKAEAGDVESAAVTVTITDDDTAGLVASSSSVAVTGSGTVSYTVKLGSQPTHSVSVTPASSADATATVATGNGDDLLTFTTDNWSTAQTVTVTGAAAGSAAVTHTSTSDDPNYVITAASASVAVTVRGLVFGASSVTAVGTGTVTYTVRLSSQPAGDVTVTATSAATATATVSPSSRVFTTDNWNTPQAFTVTGVATGATSVTHASASDDDSNYQITQAGSVDVTVGNPDPSTLTVSLTSKTVAENVGDVTLTATFDQPVKTATTVTFTASGGTATAGTDYTVPQTFTAAVAVGATEATGTVIITDDDLDEDNETFEVKAEAGDVESAAVTVTITDDDTAQIMASSSSVAVTGAGTVSYTVKLGSQPTHSVSVTPASSVDATATVATGNGDDLLTFTTDNWGSAQTVTVTGAKAGSAAVTHTSTSDDPNYVITAASASVAVTVRGLVFGASAVTAVGTGTVTYTVRLSSEPAGDVTVTATSAATATATVSPSSRVFTTDNWNTPQAFTVTGVATGTTTVTHASASDDDSNYQITQAGSVGVTVEPPTTLTVSLANTSVAESAGEVVVTATFSRAVTTATTVTFTAASGTATAGTDYTVPATFTAALTTGQSAATATVTVTDDDLDEDDETFDLAATGGGLTAPTVTVTITDDDTAGVTVSESELTVVEGSTKIYTIVLDSQPTAQVIVTPTSGTPGVATFTPSARTFQTSDWDTEQTFTVTGATTGTSTISHGSSSTDDDYGSSRTVSSVVATVLETAPPPSALTLTTSGSGSENPGTITVTATLDWPAGSGGVTVTLTGSGAATPGEDYNLPAPFTIAEDQTVASVEVTIIDDDIDEEDEEIEFRASAGDLTANAMARILDDDDAGVTVKDPSLTVVTGSTSPYTVVLDTQPTSQVVVTAASGTPGAATVAPTALTFKTSNWDTEQTFNVTGVATGDSTITHQVDSTEDANYQASLPVDSVEVTVTVTPPSTVTTPVFTPISPPTPEDAEEQQVEETADEEPADEEPQDEETEDAEEDAETEETEDEEPADEETEEDAETEETEDQDDTAEETGTSGSPETGSTARQYTVVPRAASCEPDGENGIQTFDDIPDTSFAKGDVGCIRELGVTTGTTETTYSPKDPVTREQMASFLARLFKAATGEEATVVQTPFTDVDVGSSASDDIARVYGLGITTGTSDTTYAADAIVTRGQMASFLARLYETIKGEKAPVVATPFQDVPEDSWAANDIARVYGLGITTGTSDTTYSPDDPVTREQMASFLARVYRLLTGSDDGGQSGNGGQSGGDAE